MKLMLSTLFLVALAFGQQANPITTGQFPLAGSGPNATLVLINESSMPDGQLADISQALYRKLADVAIATRLAGVGKCQAGEWCLAITDSMIGTGPDVARGARVGAEITKEIVRKILTP